MGTLRRFGMLLTTLVVLGGLSVAAGLAVRLFVWSAGL